VTIQARAITRLNGVDRGGPGRPSRCTVLVVHGSARLRGCHRRWRQRRWSWLSRGRSRLRRSRWGGLWRRKLGRARSQQTVDGVRAGAGAVPGEVDGTRTAAVENPVDGLLLRGGDPQLVGVLDVHLDGDVLAAEALVLRQPGRGVAVPLLGIRLPLNGQQITVVVGEGLAALRAELLGTLLPGIRERDDVIDVHLVGGLRAT